MRTGRLLYGPESENPGFIDRESEKCRFRPVFKNGTTHQNDLSTLRLRRAEKSCHPYFPWF